MIITTDNFTRLPSDSNGNPRYYLPVYLATEPAARSIGATVYRGKKYGAGWSVGSYNLQGDCDKINETDGNEPEPKTYQNTRMIEACHVSPTNHSPSRIKLYEKARHHADKQTSKVVCYDFEYNNVLDQAQAMLERSGFDIVCVSSWRDSYVFMVNNWAAEYLTVADIK
tara:strand:- start:3436 stop:3942 length:507 start_codon:yes stop_codon:yes gene_type:complete